ncbi:MAG: hypothetical protein H6Q71_1052 [Firmicutes bacterium]|nr:hypothetical protein [Bacillota bacterium]
MAVITVTSSADSGGGTLRRAVEDASPGDIIQFLNSISAIVLAEEIRIDKKLTINGLGSDKLIINGNNQSRIFKIGSNADVSIRDLSIIRGQGSGDYGGGAILVEEGDLTITNTTISQSTSKYGGAITNIDGSLTINNCTISNNSSEESGGAIATAGWLDITNSLFSENKSVYGGAIDNEMMITINNSTFAANHAGSSGGAIRNHGTITITNSTLSANSSNDTGGALSNSYSGDSSGFTTIINSTLSNNYAANAGGAIYNFGKLHVSFSTIAENSAPSGAGIYSSYLISRIIVAVRNSIIANAKPNCGGEGHIDASGVNFSTDSSCNCTGVTVVTEDDLKLQKLALNSPGSTETHALSTGSVAIDAARVCKDLDGKDVTIDQRGVIRPQLKACDAGAYELERPVANFTITPNPALARRLVTFDATSSTGAITEYLWDFGDGTKGSGPVVTHQYTAASKYEVTLTVTYNVQFPDQITNTVLVVRMPQVRYNRIHSRAKSRRRLVILLYYMRSLC